MMTEEKNDLDFKLAKRVVLDMGYLVSTDRRYRKLKKWENLTDEEMYRSAEFIRECILTDEPGYICAHDKLALFFEDSADSISGPVKDMDCSLTLYDKLPKIASDWYRRFDESIQQNVNLFYKLATVKLKDKTMPKTAISTN